MGIPSTMRDSWANTRKSPLIASPTEDQKILIRRQCIQEGIRAGVKAASIAFIATAVPILIAVRVSPKAKTFIHYPARVFIISSASLAAFAASAERTIHQCKRNAYFNDKSA